MVADALIYRPEVSHYVKFVATTVGRDKLLRLVQYFSRFYAWYLLRQNAAPSSIIPFAQLKATLGTARKAFRLGKFVEHFKAAAQAYDIRTTSSSITSSENILKYLTIGRQLGYAGYMTLDSVTFLDNIGAWKMKGDRGKVLAKEAYRFWFGGLLCSALAGVYKVYQLNGRESGVTGEKGEGAVELKTIQRERALVNTQLLSDMCDIMIPAYAIGYGQGYLDDGIVGLAGTVSSLLGLMSQWKKTA